MTSRGGPLPPPHRWATRLPVRKGSSPPVGTGLAASHSNANTSGGVGPSFSSPGHDHHRWELEALRSELEAERLRSEEARRHFASEVRKLRQEAERDRQLLAEQLRSKWEQRRTCELHQLQEANLREREVEIRQLLRWKEAELREAQELLQRERDAAMRQARDLQRQLAKALASQGGRGNGRSVLLSTEARAKLQGKLCRELDGEQAVQIRHLKAELELERSLFLKYILERFEGDRDRQAYGVASSQRQQPEHQVKHEKTRHLSLESLGAARCSPDAKPASKSPSLNGDLTPSTSSHHHLFDLLDGKIPKEGSDTLFQPQKVLEDARQGDRPLEEVSKAPTGPPLEGKRKRWELKATGQQHRPQGRMPASGHDQPRKQNKGLLKVLLELEEECALLREENAQLRQNDFLMGEPKQLQKNSRQLTKIARWLEEMAKRLLEASLKASYTPATLGLSGPDGERDKILLAWPQAKKMNEAPGVALAKIQHLCLQKECWEIQTKLATGVKSPSFFKIIDFAPMLGEPQREVLLLERQHQKESADPTKIRSDYTVSPVTQETLSGLCLEDPIFPKATAKVSMSSLENTENKAFFVQNGPKSNENGVLDTDSDSEIEFEALKEKPSEHASVCDALKCEVEGKQDKCHHLESQLNKVVTEAVRIAEPNSPVYKKREWNEKTKKEYAEVKARLVQAIDHQNSAIQLTKELLITMENFGQSMGPMPEKAEKTLQLASGHKETVLQKEEETPEQQIQTESKDHDEVAQLLEDQVKKLENQDQGSAEQSNLQEAVQLHINKSEPIQSESPPSIDSSTPEFSKGKCLENNGEGPTTGAFNGHTVCSSENVSDQDTDSIDSSGPFGKAEVRETHSNSPETQPIQDSSRSSPDPENDTPGEQGEMESDNISVNLLLQNPCSPKLRVFLARHSYDPFRGPNKNPEAELPLTAGEYVYVYGEMDEDGFYEGELMDGKRGMVPSNLIEEISHHELISFVSSSSSSDEASNSTANTI